MKSIWKIVLSDTAKGQLDKLDKKYVLRIERLLDSMASDPFSGIGKPEPLKHMRLWSRRIDKKNRLLYTVRDNVIEVSSIGEHY